MASEVDAVIDKALEMQDRILDLDNTQVEMHLLRSCLGICRVNHLLRTVPRDLILEQLYRFDESLRSCLSRVIHSTIPDATSLSAFSPGRSGN